MLNFLSRQNAFWWFLVACAIAAFIFGQPVSAGILAVFAYGLVE
jgi:hypothetical protein